MSSKKLENLKMRLADMIIHMPSFELMLPGDFREVYRKCGKKNCWCFTSEKGHPFIRVVWSDKGKIKTKAIPKQDFKWIKMVTDNYSIFRKERGKIFKLVRKFANELNKLEAKAINTARKKRNYL